MTRVATTQDELFAPTSLSFPLVLFPFTWLWRFFTRRFGIFAAKWNETEPTAELLVKDIVYGETPRFRLEENALYFTDMLGKQVLRWDLDKKQHTLVYESNEGLSGLGWLPDGRLLIVAMVTRKLLAFNEKTKVVEEYADISEVTRHRANDMVVDTKGRAYVGNFGYDFADALHARTTTVVRVDLDRSVHVEATKMLFPNGSVITPDGKTLIIAETFAGDLTAFDIASDGSLSNRRVWAHVGLPCDGICLDAEGCVWASISQVGAYPIGGALVRVQEGGAIKNLYGFGQNGISNGVFACQLGTDAQGKHYLFFLEAKTAFEDAIFKHGPAKARENGQLKAIPVAVGPARIPGNNKYCGGYC
ncbi:hypothetical protein Poli38472_003491 [Pythium oligandrum]|uniref:SMP-30/Gluconolactonase/LRE-like region domain-containing protein n=1 Tax=Pythium oligandrum TaxID=41045 RepID=A0A8K1C6Z0_PYTOL|nr:hypothetical protein Poli38472_003491 [Pythium oligandrum]|eukprot:TMW57566.1 hypothetical protein Poli38472_003491 [Pythium oligandrum]